MSEEKKWPYKVALDVAQHVGGLLDEHCYTWVIAGSIRREKPEVKDIEIVCVPKPFETGLFESGIATVLKKWPKIKGDLDKHCKYTQRILPGGMTLDLFFADEKNFGNIFLIRTGDWEFSKHFMGVLLPRQGYKSEGGYVTKNGKIISTPDERNLFELAKVKWIEPKHRTIEVFKNGK